MDIASFLDSVATPSETDMVERWKLARKYTLVFLRMGPAPRNDRDRYERIHWEHLRHLAKLQLLGKLALNGPTQVDRDIQGVSVYAAELDEARALAEADPKVQAGYLIVEAIPWMAIPGDCVP